MSLPLVVVAALLVAVPAWSAEPTYRVESGDTLWDLSERFWGDAETWPELWALNPHIHNPHWIYPGDLLFPQRPVAEFAPQRRVVRLPLERLQPPVPAVAATPTRSPAAAAVVAPNRVKVAGGQIRLRRGQALDFIVPAPIARLGTVHNRHQVKIAYAEGEDLEFDVPAGASLAPGDLVTLFDDSVVVADPADKEVTWGHYVNVLGHLEVYAVAEGRGVGRILETYDVVEDGDGLMAYRPPVGTIAVHDALPGVEGTILRGDLETLMFSEEDVVFLNRGAAHGLDRGALLEVPVRKGSRSAQGLVDLGSPLALLVVVDVQEATSTCVVADSRLAVEVGDRVVAAVLSP